MITKTKRPVRAVYVSFCTVRPQSDLFKKSPFIEGIYPSILCLLL